MQHRVIVRLAVATLMLLHAPFASARHAGAPATGATTAQPWYDSITTLDTSMGSGKIDAVDLTRQLLRRIVELDQGGPAVNSVIEVNPDALEIARQRDRQHGNGHAHDPLWGIPVMLKDNIDTGDKMLTTAGSLAMTGAPAPRDATVAAKLRQAGAVILGKTNLSEWANFRSSLASSGWSGRGGLTRHPYVLDRSACGSSSGSAAAVAAGFATVAIGTETNGSIICPAAANGVVGIKPTVGLVSRAGIVPISHSQDTAGPIARNVTDAAIVLGAIAGSDPRDPATADADQHATDYTQFLDADALAGKRIGVVRKHGATVIDPVELPHLGDYGKAEFTVLLYEFKHDLNAYLATRKHLAVHSLADLIAWDKAHAAAEMPWFGQNLFIQAEAK